MVTEKNTFLHFFRMSHQVPRSKSLPPTRIASRQSPSYSLDAAKSVEDVQPAPSTKAQNFESQRCAGTINYEQWENWMDEEGIYTVMIRHIPCSCKRQHIVEAIRLIDFGDKYDFFYAPTRNGKSRGYAFVGFPNPTLTREFAKTMTGFRFAGKSSPKTITVVPANVQGLNENMEHFEGTFVMRHKDAKPTFQTRPETN